MINNNLESWPKFTEEEAEYVKNILLSNRVNYWTGDEIRKFEIEYKDYTNANHALALMNGTVALEAALVALGIGKNDEVIVSPRSFIASVSCVVSVGAKPVFCDVDKISGNITAEYIEEKLTSKVKAIICVHLAGWPCDMYPILELARKHGLYVVEDCAQAHGAKYDGKSVGTLGDIGAWSFCQDKIITTGGEGGMITCKDNKIYEKIWSYRDHGKSRIKVEKNLKINSTFKWIHDEFGTNLRMTEMQAAIGRIQLRKLDKWIEIRNENASKIQNSLLINNKISELVRIPKIELGKSLHAYYKLYVYLNLNEINKVTSREEIVMNINKKGVPCFTGVCPEIYLEDAFLNKKFKPTERLINAKKLGEESLVFLVHPTLTQNNITKTQEAIIETFSIIK